jgi:enamine deaminase RidA (YjgF/YER057c/UK114 family)
VEARQINPWAWGESYGITQAWRVVDATTFVMLSGQGPLDSDGKLVGPDDFEAQARQTFRNIRTIVEAGGTSLDHVVKLTAYLLDMTRLPDYARVRAEFLDVPYPAASAVGVSALAVPGMLIEVEATVVF